MTNSLKFCLLWSVTASLAGCAGYEITGREFGWKPASAMVNGDDQLLWQAYTTQSDSLLQLFFDRWEAESVPDTTDVPQDELSDVTSSLLYYLLLDRSYWENSQDRYLLVQDSIDVAAYDYGTGETGYYRLDVRPLLPWPGQIPDKHLLVMDAEHRQIIERFLGVPSEEKMEAANVFFRDLITARSDTRGEMLRWSWCLPVTGWSVGFTSDLNGVSVADSLCGGSWNSSYRWIGDHWTRVRSLIPVAYERGAEGATDR